MDQKKKRKSEVEGCYPSGLCTGCSKVFGELSTVNGTSGRQKSGLTTSTLISRMTRMIDERVRDEGNKGRIAPMS